MDKLIRDLAIARRTVQRFKDDIAAVEAEIEAQYGERLGHLKDSLRLSQDDVLEYEQRVRDAALESYQADGNKHPHPAITVKVFTYLLYDEGVALDYCIQHLQSTLKMDKTKFEKVAKVVKPDFVEIGQEPKPTIARDLSEYE